MRFRLADFPSASNQSVPLSKMSRFARKIRELFIEGEICECCGTKIRAYFFRSEHTLSMRQCHIECSGCRCVFHFLCYLEAVGASKGEGAVYRWPKGGQGERHVAPCPKCKKKDACMIVLEGAKKPFADDETVRAGV